jgi:hypothetical protein
MKVGPLLFGLFNNLAGAFQRVVYCHDIGIRGLAAEE